MTTFKIYKICNIYLYSSLLVKQVLDENGCFVIKNLQNTLAADVRLTIRLWLNYVGSRSCSRR